MDYYKKLFFFEKKHSYRAESVIFHRPKNHSKFLEYDNSPSIGMKILGNGLLDPVTGFYFSPENFWTFKEKLIVRNLLVNGICLVPIIFEYIKTNTFHVHIYDDVKDSLNLISIGNDDTVSLSETEFGTVIRSLEDELYYIYLGSVAQFYVSGCGKGSVRKKHLVIKLEYVSFDGVMVIKDFAYKDYNKDKDKSYVKIRNLSKESFNIKRYYFTEDNINMGDYFVNGEFDVSGFVREHPSYVLTRTVRMLFSKHEIKKTKNVVKLKYEYIGESTLVWAFKIIYGSCNDLDQMFYKCEIIHSLLSPEFHDVDFFKYNYAIEYCGEKYIISTRRLEDLDCYSPHYRKVIDVYGVQTFNLYLYKMNESTATNNDEFFLKCNSRDLDIDFLNPIKLYKIQYELNGAVLKNIFSTRNSIKVPEFFVQNKNVYDVLKADNFISYNLGHSNDG